MKRLLLSLTLIIGISRADTTDNLVNQQGQLDHKSTYYYTESSQTYVIPEDAEWRNPTSIDWSVDVRSHDNAVGCYSNCVDDTAGIDIRFYDDNYILLDSTGTGRITLDYDNGGWSGWINYSGSYDNETYLSEIASIQFVVGGVDNGYWAGNYGAEFRNAELTFEYNPVEESLIIEVEQEIFDLLDDLDMGHIDFHEFNDYLTDIQHDFKLDMEEAHDDMPMDDFKEFDKDFPSPDIDEIFNEEFDEFKEDVKEIKADIIFEQEGSNKKKPSDSPKSQREHLNTGDNNYNTIQHDISSNDTSNAMATLELVKTIEVLNNGLSDIVSLDTYTSVTIGDRISLEDNDDWYQDKAFYESIGMNDSGILNGYSNTKLNDGDWYGSDTKFY